MTAEAIPPAWGTTEDSPGYPLAWHERFSPTWIGTELRYIHDSGNVVIRFNRLHPTSDGLTAYIEVHYLPSNTLLHAGRWDLMGSTTISRLAKAVNERAQAKRVPVDDWDDAMHHVVYDAIQLHLEGDPIHRLADVEASRQKFLLRPLVGSTGATSIIAEGGTFKSALAMAVALSVASGRTGYLQIRPEKVGPVLYLDWEADAATHAERSAALALDPADRTHLLYQHQKGRPIASTAEQIKRRIDSEGVVLAVIDSVMLARGGDANSVEATIAFYAALAALDVPCLLIDHKSREAIRKGQRGAYGSVVNDNSLRLSWEISGKHEMPDGSSQILLVPSKRNNFGQLPRLAYEVRIETDEDEMWRSASFTRVSDKVVRIHRPDELPLQKRIVNFLLERGGAPMRVSEIAEGVREDPDKVRATLNRYQEEFVNIAQGKSGMWTLRHELDRYRNELGRNDGLPPNII